MSTQAVEPAPARSTAPSLRSFIAFFLIAGIPVGIVGWRAVAAREAMTAATIEARLPVLSDVPDFELTERSGRPLSGRDLRGKVWVADFIFTYCAGPCPLMSANMAKLQKVTANVPGIAMVSFSVDPERDTPEVLREYADRYSADPARWLFLTGSMDTIQRLAVTGFKVGDVKNPILHSTRFILVDAEGRIRGYYDSEEAGVIERIADDVLALRGAPVR